MTTATHKKKAPSGREQTTIRFPIGWIEKLKKEAYEKGLSFNAYIIILIDKARSYQQQ